MSRQWLWIAGAAIAVLPRWFGGEYCAAADSPSQASLATEIGQLFELAGKSTPTAIEAVDAQFARMHARFGDERHLQFALALARIKQHRVAEAIQSIDVLLQSGKAELPVYRAQAWCELASHQPAAALISLDALGKRLAAESAATAIRQAEDRDDAAFLGRAFAYLEWKTVGVDEAKRDAAKNAIVDRLGDEDAAAFRAAHDEAVGAFDQFDRDQLTAKAAALDDQQRQRENKTKVLDYQRDKLDKNKKDLTQSTDKQNLELTRQLAEIDGSLADVRVQMGRLDQQAASARNDRDLNAINGRSRELESQVALLRAKRRSLELSQQVAALEAKRQAAEMRQTEKRLRADTKKAASPQAANAPQLRELALKSGAYSAFEKFPLERDEQRLLAALQ